MKIPLIKLIAILVLFTTLLIAAPTNIVVTSDFLDETVIDPDAIVDFRPNKDVLMPTNSTVTVLDGIWGLDEEMRLSLFKLVTITKIGIWEVDNTGAVVPATTNRFDRFWEVVGDEIRPKE